MSRSRSMMFAVCISFLLLVTGAKGRQATDIGPEQRPVQSSQKKITLDGIVQEVALLPGEGGTCTHLKLSSRGHIVDVHLGPTRVPSRLLKK